LNDALFDVLVQNKVEFVHLFMERVDLKTVLNVKRLNNLYAKVFTTCVLYNMYGSKFGNSVLNTNFIHRVSEKNIHSYYWL